MPDAGIINNMYSALFNVNFDQAAGSIVSEMHTLRILLDVALYVAYDSFVCNR